jgi:hypothetical protein
VKLYTSVDAVDFFKSARVLKPELGATPYAKDAFFVVARDSKPLPRTVNVAESEERGSRTCITVGVATTIFETVS